MKHKNTKGLKHKTQEDWNIKHKRIETQDTGGLKHKNTRGLKEDWTSAAIEANRHSADQQIIVSCRKVRLR